MAFVFENKAITYLDTPLGSAATNIIVGSGEGDKFPSPTGGDLSPLVLEDRLTGAYEILYLTSRVGDQLNVNRAQENTLAQSWPTGSNLSVRATKDFYNTLGSYGDRIQANEDDIVALQDSDNALVETVVNALYPVGALYMSTNSENPGTTLGFGTWIAYAQGRAIVGVGSADGTSWAGGEAKGESNHALSVSELPAHKHDVSVVNASNGAHTHGYTDGIVQQAASGIESGGEYRITSTTRTTDSAGAHTHTATVTETEVGSGEGHNNIQPSIGVYIWRRTAL